MRRRQNNSIGGKAQLLITAAAGLVQSNRI